MAVGTIGSENVSTSSRSGYAWNTLGLVTRQLLTFGISVTIFRTLSPHDFGLMSLVNIFLVIAANLEGLGLNSVIVYYKDNESEYATYNSLSAIFGLVLSLVVCGIAPAAAAFYGQPQLALLLQVCSISLILTGFRTVSNGVLAKRMAFKSLRLIDVFSSVTGATVALVMALSGFGVWSLVANSLVSATITTVAMLRLVPPRFSLEHLSTARQKLTRYGMPATLSNLLWQLYDKSDFMVVGRLLDATLLGAYTLAFTLATLINDKIGTIVSSVTFSAFSALQEDREKVVYHWLTLVSGLSLLSFPALAGLAIAADDVIGVVYGRNWQAAITPLRLLCVVGMLRTLTPVTLSLMSAQGRPDVNLRYAAMNATLLPVGFYAGCTIAGLEGVALAWCVLFPLTCLYLFLTACRLLRFPLRSLVAALAPAAIVSSLASAPILLVHHFLEPGVGRLAAILLTGGVVQAGTTLAVPKFRSLLRRLVKAE